MNDRSNQVAARIRSAILKHRLMPGDKLTERDIVEAVGVSRVVARQALIRLSEEGLVSWEVNRGASVARPDVAEIIALFDALTSIEQSVVEKAEKAIGTPEWDALRRQTGIDEQVAKKRPPELEGDVSADFHLLLVATTKNRFLIEFHEKLVRRVMLLNSLFRLERSSSRLIHDHDRIAILIEEGKIARAKRLIEQHYADVLRSYDVTVEPSSAMSLREALSGVA